MSPVDKHFNLNGFRFTCILITSVEAFTYAYAQRSTLNLILISEKKDSLELLVSRFGIHDMQIGVE